MADLRYIAQADMTRICEYFVDAMGTGNRFFLSLNLQNVTESCDALRELKIALARHHDTVDAARQNV